MRIFVLVAIGEDGRNLQRQTGCGRLQLEHIDRRGGGDDEEEEFPAAELWLFVASMREETMSFMRWFRCFRVRYDTALP